MTAKQDANLGLNYGWTEGEDGWGGGMDDNLLKLGALVGANVEAVANSPTVTADGARYIVGPSPAGAFSTATAGQLAVRVSTAWTFYTPSTGWDVFNKTTGTVFRFTGMAWSEDASASVDPLVRRHEDNLMGGVTGIANAPTITADGTRYIVGGMPAGEFAIATPNQIAAKSGGQWRFYTPFNGQRIYNYATSTDYRFTGSAWEEIPTGGGSTTDGPLATKHENVWYGPVTAVADTPSVTTNGTRYIVGSTPSGAFAGQAGQLAVRVAGNWVFYAPFAGLTVFNLATGTPWRHNGTIWINSIADSTAAKAASSSVLAASPAGVREFMEQYGFTANYMTDATDLNAVTSTTDRTVCFGFNASTLNIPFSEAYGRGIMFAGGGNYSTQIAWINGTGEAYIRYHEGTTWTQWSSFSGRFKNKRHIEGLDVYVTGTSIIVGTGSAYIPSTDSILDVASEITLPVNPASLSASTWYHIYLYDNAGTPAIEIATTAPSGYALPASQKAGDASRRYLGSFRMDSGKSMRMAKMVNGVATLLGAWANINRVLANGTATSITAVPIDSLVPVTAKEVKVAATNQASQGVPCFYAGNSDGLATVTVQTGNQKSITDIPLLAYPNIYYGYVNAVGSGGLFIDVGGYSYAR